MDLTTLMRQAARLNSAFTAIVTEDESFTFQEAWTRGVRLANALIEFGVKPGDRVAGLQDNNIGCVDLYLACAIAGAVRVPMYPRNSGPAHQKMLAGTDCVVLMVDDTYIEEVAGVGAAVASLRHVLVRDATYEGWLASQDDVDSMVEVDPDGWAVIRHSGGTTGTPKGVGYTSRDWVLNCRNWAYGLPTMTRHSVVGHAGPISHASGYLFLPGWLCGASNVLFGAFDPEKVLRMMREHRVSHVFASPSLLTALAHHPEAAGEWPDLRSLMVGGAPITDATALFGREVFGDVLYQGFGQTEAVPLAIMGPQDWFGEFEGSNPLRAAGLVHPFAQVRILDPLGNEVPLGHEGEIVAKVEGQMRLYWGDEELTRSRLRDGWVHTQDIGYLDHNGFLYVLDRADDLIVSGGFNIWPAELETVLADHPAVIEAAVFGVPSTVWGETPLAVVTVLDPEAVSSAELIEMCAQRLGSYKKPSDVVITTDALPKTLVGKLARKELRTPYWDGHERRVGGV